MPEGVRHAALYDPFWARTLFALKTLKTSRFDARRSRDTLTTLPIRRFIARYREYLTSRPDDSAALTKLGIALAAVGKLDEAIQTFRSVVAVDAGNAMAMGRRCTHGRPSHCGPTMPACTTC